MSRVKGYVYKFENKAFLQTKREFIGLEQSGSLSILNLIWFGDVFLETHYLFLKFQSYSITRTNSRIITDLDKVELSLKLPL